MKVAYVKKLEIEAAIIYGVLVAGWLIMFRDVFFLIALMAAVIPGVCVILIQRRKYLTVYINESAVTSVRKKQAVCTVDFDKLVYYDYVVALEMLWFVDRFLVVSNENFGMSNDTVYDERKQVLIYLGKATRKKYPYANWIRVPQKTTSGFLEASGVVGESTLEMISLISFVIAFALIGALPEDILSFTFF